MGFKEAEERAKKAQAEDKASRDIFLSQDIGFGSHGGKLPKFMSEVRELGAKFPENKFDADFIRDIDSVCSTGINVAAIGNLLVHYAKRGTSTDHLRGFTQKGILAHLGKVLSKYRSEIYEPIKSVFEGGGK